MLLNFKVEKRVDVGLEELSCKFETKSSNHTHAIYCQDSRVRSRYLVLVVFYSILVETVSRVANQLKVFWEE